MGLLEKALRFKNELNHKGKETLIDKIKGPAETDLIEETESTKGEKNEKIDTYDFSSKEKKLEETIGDDESEFITLDDSELEEIEKKIDEDNFGIESIEHDSSGMQSTQRVKHEETYNERGLAPEPRSKSSETGNGNNYKNIFRDYLVLYETGREILKCTELDTFFDALSFLIMGQIGVSSSSLLVQKTDESGKWYITESRGINIEDKNFDVNSYSGIMTQLIDSKNIVDIEDYKDDESLTEEFYKYISIDTRLLVPLIFNDVLNGVIVIGDKITNEPYSEEEYDYLYAVTELAAPVLHTILNRLSLLQENEHLEKNIQYIRDIDQVYETILKSPDLEKLREVIQKEFSSLGIECYSYFSNFGNEEKYKPFVYEIKDYLLYSELDFSMPKKSNLISFLKEGEAPLIIENYSSSRMVNEVFNENQISKMNMFHIFPYRLGMELTGFALINKIADHERLHEIEIKLKRLTRILFPLVNSIYTMGQKKKNYIDTIESIYTKIDREIEQSIDLKNPVTLVLFTIKNYKRYHNLFGIESARKLIDSFEKIVKTRLSDVDFSVRYDRNKIIVVLPGKNKKYAVPFANTIKNELMHKYKKKEMQLLITFLTSSYPEDGNNVYSLMDAID